ncbi:WXG100 family type VII secretion target [Nocardia sp. NPDC050710]|uniref:WXG100 family type VII secretion target n=1 Tax=Nocardia sp. NPDC050710 TaxID=3157220 RepID=UPI0033D31EC3
MGQSLYVDPDEMRRTAAELRALAEETARVVAELKADLAREGECWGDDKPGKTFAESYVPGAKQGMTGFENLVQNVEAMSSNLRSTVESFENQDRDAGNSIRDSDSDTGSTRVPGTTYPSWNDQSNSGGDQDRQAPGTGQAPNDAAQSGSGSPAAGNNGTNAQQPAGQRHADSSAGSNSPGSDSGPGGHQQQAPSQPTTPGPNPSAPAASAPSPAASASPSPGSGRGAGTPTTSTPNAQPPGGRNASAPAASRNPGAPWSKLGTGTSPEQQSPPPGGRNASAPRNPGAPWSKPGTGTSPEQQPPPRVAPPRRPAAPKPAPEPEQRKNPAPKVQPKPVTGDEAMRIITAMAVRHNLHITGFEASGISAQTAQEISDAVDSVLTKYPIALRGIEIAESGGDLSSVENRAEPTAPEPEPEPEPWIVLDRRAVDDPGALSGRDQPRARPVGNAHRPMRTRILREFGHVADLVGGFRARQTVQRALITEYLRVTGAEGRTLAHVVDGYRRWRDQLGENCFRDGVLDPGRALAEGFATVEQGGVQAPGPAKVLHRLLLVMARLDMQ